MINLLDPQIEDITLRDIAYHLSRIPRFNGATIGRFPWSIADHSLLVEHFMSLLAEDPRWLLAALLHDAHEFVTGDITRPVQSALWTVQGPRAAVDAIEFIQKMIQDRIHDRFNLPITGCIPVEIRATIRLCDNQALNYERKTLLAPSPEENWSYLPVVPDNVPLLLAREPMVSAQRFARRALRLWLMVNDYTEDTFKEISSEAWYELECVTTAL